MKTSLASILALLALPVLSLADEIRLRDGAIMTGTLLNIQRDAYLFRESSFASPMQSIPKAAVQTILLDDPAQADRILDIRSTVRRYAQGEPAPVGLLPTRSFGNAILNAVQNARTSIWISAYYISGSTASPIKDFYDTLAEKARQGLDVVVVCEFGPGTGARIREATYNYALELQPAGVRVLFIRERRILHKKMILVDGITALLGSSNLSMAGTLQSDELNVESNNPNFAARVRRDFERLFAMARSPDSVHVKETKSTR